MARHGGTGTAIGTGTATAGAGATETATTTATGAAEEAEAGGLSLALMTGCAPSAPRATLAVAAPAGVVRPLALRVLALQLVVRMTTTGATVRLVAAGGIVIVMVLARANRVR